MSFYQRFRSFVPHGEDNNWNVRAQILVAFMSSLGGFGLFYWWPYYRVGNPFGAAAIICEFTMLLGLINRFRKTRRLKQTTNQVMVGYCLMMLAIMVTSGGVTYSASAWWVVAPVFATLVAGVNLGKRYFVCAIVVLVGMYAMELMGFRFPDYISEQPEDAGWVAFLDWFHYVGVMLYTMLMTLMFDFINQMVMGETRKALAQAEEATNRAENQSRYLGESVEVILKKMSALAEGDLTARLMHKKDDEIGRLCQGFNQAVERVQDAITDILKAVEIASQSSKHISNSAGQLAEGTQEHTDHMNEINEAVEQMVSSITQNTEGAGTSSEAARNNGRIAREGGMIVAETVYKIDEIATVVEESSKSIQMLASASKQIGQIVSVIQDITSKTNLLALNASIEAAHAGAAGRGFGVIADEVKELANKTAEATHQITEMIHNIQKGTSKVITDMEKGLAQVREGKLLANQAGGALEEIVTSSENLSGLVAQISTACEDQSRQSNEFVDRILEMKRVTDESQDAINEIATSTVKLDGLNQQVKEQVDRFHLEEV